MLIIYRETTGEVVENTGTNSYFLDGPPEEQAWQNYPDRDGLALLRLHDVRDADLVQAALTHQTTVVDGELVIGDPLQVPAPLPPDPPAPMSWATAAQAELVAQRQILDLLLLGGLDDDGGTIDGEIGSDLPDSGGTLDDLEGLDLGTLPDSGETLDDLASLEG